MKFIKSSLILPFLFLFIQICIAQETPKAILVDSFGAITCEDVLARNDNFMTELSNNPNSQGYVVIYPKKGSFKQALSFEKLISGSIYFRRFDRSRVTFVRGSQTDEFKVELWRVPPGAETSSFTEEKWIDLAQSLTKPFVYASLSSEDICPTFSPETYADLLKNNPDLRGHIVIFNKSKKEAETEKKEWLKLFTEDQKVPKNRLKFFFAKNDGYPEVEFWIVPRK